MTTNAKLATNPPQGSGLTARLLDDVYADLVQGRSVDYIPVVGLLRPIGHGEHETANGKKRHVALEFVRLEPATDDHARTQVTHMVQDAYAARTSRPSQLTLDGLGSDDERRDTVLGYIREWANEQGIDDAELERRWWGDADGGGGYYDREFVAAMDKASYVQLREFAGAVGAIDETPEPVEPVGPVFSDADEEAAEASTDMGDDGPEDGAE